MEIDDSKIRNKNIKGCIICQNVKLAKEIDPILFKAEMSLKTLKERLENMGIFIDGSELRTHTRHLFYEKEEITNEMDEETQIGAVSNVEMVKKLMGKVSKHIKLLEVEGKSNTMEHQKLLKQQMELLELKSKLEGDLKPAEVAVLPDWVRKAEEEESNKVLRKPDTQIE